MYICMYIYIYIYIYIAVSKKCLIEFFYHIWHLMQGHSGLVCVCVCMCVYLYMCMCMYVCGYVYVCIYVCMCISVSAPRLPMFILLVSFSDNLLVVLILCIV